MLSHRRRKINLPRSIAGARTVSVRSAFADESNRRIFKIPPRHPLRTGTVRAPAISNWPTNAFKAATQFGATLQKIFRRRA
jgi:hypothetical protein